MLIYAILMLPYLFSSAFANAEPNHDELFMLSSILSPVLVVVLGGFGWVSWYQAIQGETTIEHKGKQRDDGKNYEFGKKDYRLNLFVIFGTKSYFMAVMPSVRTLPTYFRYKTLPQKLDLEGEEECIIM